MSGNETPPSRRESDRRILVALVVAPLAGVLVMGFAWSTLVAVTAWWGGDPMTEFFGVLLVGLPFYFFFVLIFAIIGSVLMAVIGLPILWVFRKRGIVSRRAWSATGAVAALMPAFCWTGGFGAFQNAEAVSAILGPLLISPFVLLGGAVTGITAWAIVRPDRWPRPRAGA